MEDVQLDLFGEVAPPKSPRRKASLFFALLPPTSMLPAISSCSEALLQRHGLQDRVVSKRWHITLCALGDGGPPPEALVSSARCVAGSVQASRFSIEFLHAMRFAQSGAYVLAGPDKGSPFSLFGILLFSALKSAGLRPYGRSAAAHLTLAYQHQRALPEHTLERPIRWEVERFVLAHSVRGAPEYNILGEWALR